MQQFSEGSQKRAFHLVTAIHDSRTSRRMIDYKARERRFYGTKPFAEVFLMTAEEEELIATIVGEIVRENNIEITAFNLCRDHMHLLVICIPEDVPKIMHKIKGRTARACNAYKRTIAEKGESTDVCGVAVAIKGINPLDAHDAHRVYDIYTRKNIPTPPLKDGSTPFWTQKYGCKPIRSAEQYRNTFNYIRNNRIKHRLPENLRLQELIDNFPDAYSFVWHRRSMSFEI